MKANAPKKIYLHPTAKGGVGASWLTLQLTDEDIEYTRTDAFIEKACNAYCKVCRMPNCKSKNCKYIGDFRKYMKGEYEKGEAK